MTPRRTVFADFILDLLDFMEQKLREALESEASRVGAVNEAAGAVPVLRARLRENEMVQAQFMLVFDNELYEPYATERWRNLAGMPCADFEAEVEAFLKPGGTFPALRAVAGTPQELG